MSTSLFDDSRVPLTIFDQYHSHFPNNTTEKLACARLYVRSPLFTTFEFDTIIYITITQRNVETANNREQKKN